MPFPSRIDPATLGHEALAVVEASGWESWSLREVASAVGVTPNALYRHVDGREGLNVAVGAAAARALLDQLDAAPTTDDPVADTLALARAYLRFGLDRPHAYRAFITAKPDLDHPAIDDWVALWRVMVARIGPAAPGAEDALCLSLWALLHGRLDLATAAARYAAADAGIDEAITGLVTGFRAAGSVPSPLPDIVRAVVDST